MSPFLGFTPGTRMFSIFLEAADRSGAFCVLFFRGFFGGSGCRVGSLPASLLLRRGGAAGFFAGFLAGFFLPHRHSAKARPA